MKRRITIPGTVTVKSRTPFGQTVESEQTMASFVADVLLQDRRFVASRESMHQADDIEDFFRDAKPDDVVDMPESLWKVLASVAEKPNFGQGGGYAPEVRQMRTYLDAICDAPVAPTEAANDESDAEAKPKKKR